MFSLSRVGIICFAASYAIVLLLEISRLVFRSGVRGAFMVGWAAAGLVAHTIFLYYQAVGSAGPPLSSWQDWFLVAAWFLMLVYLYLIFYHPHNMLGIFLMPLVLGLIALGWFVSPAPFARQPASQIWGGIHGTSIGLAATAMLFGFAVGLMYLWQDHRLKHKIPPGKGLKLPSLEWLQHAAIRSMVVATVMVGLGVLTGMVLNSIDPQPAAERLRWSDPIVLGTSLMFVWLLFSVHVSYLFRRARRGRIVAYLAALSFLILVAVLAAGFAFNSQHGGRKGESRRGKAEEKIVNRPLQIANRESYDRIYNHRSSILPPSAHYPPISYPLSPILRPPSPNPSPLAPRSANAISSRRL